MRILQAESIYVADCELGRGLFAARAFTTYETILHFTGPLISLAEAIAKGDSEGNPLQVGPVSYIDLEPPGVFANHSCEPNAGIRDDVVLVALRPIAAGEEIRYDYSTTMWEESVSGGGWNMPCRCGSTMCRSVVANFPTLPADLRARYLALGIVQTFIVRRAISEELYRP